jgi:hypothetical protein
MLQATLSDSLFLDLFPFSENGLIVPKVNTEDAKQAFYSDMLTSTENGLCSQSPKTYDVVIV